MRRFGEPRLVVVARWIWLCELIPLPRQELPAAILLLPDLQRADPGAVGLAVQLAFRNVEMAGNRTAADDRVFASMRLNQTANRGEPQPARLNCWEDSPPSGAARSRPLIAGSCGPIPGSYKTTDCIWRQARPMPPQESAAPARSDRYSRACPTSKRACKARSSRSTGRETCDDTEALRK